MCSQINMYRRNFLNHGISLSQTVDGCHCDIMVISFTVTTVTKMCLLPLIRYDFKVTFNSWIRSEVILKSRCPISQSFTIRYKIEHIDFTVAVTVTDFSCHVTRNGNVKSEKCIWGTVLSLFGQFRIPVARDSNPQISFEVN